MSSNRPGEPNHEYTDADQRQSFLQRRFEAFADRTRDPGDALTWSVVLGSLVGTLLVICFAVAGRTTLVLLPLAIFIVWIIVVSVWGRVNVAAILWGAAAQESRRGPNTAFILWPTVALAAFALVCVAIDAVTGWGFRWYGTGLTVVALWCLVVSAQAALGRST